MRVVPFKAWHLIALDRQPRQPERPEDAEPAAYEAGGPAWTVIGPDRLPIACAGFLEASWPGQALAWSILGVHLGALMVPFTRRVRHEFAAAGYRRLEAIVESDHAEGHRWARLIGMTREGTLRRWGPRGVDHDIYARVAA